MIYDSVTHALCILLCILCNPFFFIFPFSEQLGPDGFAPGKRPKRVSGVGVRHHGSRRGHLGTGRWCTRAERGSSQQLREYIGRAHRLYRFVLEEKKQMGVGF